MNLQVIGGEFPIRSGSGDPSTASKGEFIGGWVVLWWSVLTKLAISRSLGIQTPAKEANSALGHPQSQRLPDDLHNL